MRGLAWVAWPPRAGYPLDDAWAPPRAERLRRTARLAGEESVCGAPRVQLAKRASNGTIIKATMLMILMSGLTAGPAVSL